MMMHLSMFEARVLNACAGKYETGVIHENSIYADPARLATATSRLKDLGLIYFCYDDDQPTHYATELGEEFAAAKST